MSLEPITKELLRSWSAEQLKQEMKNPERLAQINTFLTSRDAVALVQDIAAEPVSDEPTEEIVVQLEPQPVVVPQSTAEEDQIEIDKLQAEQVERAAVEARQESPRKIVVEYQAKDEVGNPIGRPTHLEAYSWEEMSKKQTEAHIQATRAFHRLKAQKTTFNRQEPVIPSTMSDAELVQAAEDLKSEDVEKAAIADRKLRADSILKQQAQLAVDRQNAREKEVALEFMTRHIEDYNRCQANGKILASYLRDNDLEWTVDNLELAFAATESQLAPKEVPVANIPEPKPENNPPAPVPQALAPTPVPAIQPAASVAAETPVTQVPAANPPAAAHRPGVNAGIIPGTNSGVRPTGKPQGLTMKEIKGWTAEQMRREMKNPARKAEIARLLASRSKTQ